MTIYSRHLVFLGKKSVKFRFLLTQMHAAVDLYNLNVLIEFFQSKLSM